MRTNLPLIAAALLLLCNVAVAQEQKTPSAGVLEQESPSEKMTGQDAQIAKDIGDRVGEIVRDVIAEGRRGGGMRGHSMRGHGMRGHGMRGHGMMGHHMMGKGMPMRVMLILMDTDGDGSLSLEEVQAGHARIFKAIDTDKDGKVTLEEVQMFFRGDFPAAD